MQSLAVYIHWPFCQSKCPYCDFNSHVAASIDHQAWCDAYARELAYYAQLLPQRRVTSIFFGGGTPSLMEVKTVETILGSIAEHWTMAEDVEITLEANPTSVEAEKFSGFRAAGVNRLSLGVQSLRDEALKFLGRGHDTAQARKAIELAARHFPRFSFDLIYARQGQKLADWEIELREALSLAGEHLSLYQLTIEPNTAFYTLAGRGEKLTAPDPEAAAMYETTQAILTDAGLPAYEISNHARPGEESRHNLAYWHYDDYIGIGPGAHGRYVLNGGRYATDTHRAPSVWLEHVGKKGNGLRLCDALDDTTSKREVLMMGLRLAEGIAHADWQEKFGSALVNFIAPEKTARLEKEGYLAASAATLQATLAGRQRLDAVLKYLLEAA
ncbi:MAG: radical SAM family heme chaperone HemW [Alphaproteobacteria bacterium]|nr:radical SAM family heme chaperone HemW [Alphaproteobacteria bacterium]